MCPIYIEAVIQISDGPQTLKEGRLRALKRSQEREAARPLLSAVVSRAAGTDWGRPESFSRPAGTFADHAGFEADLRGWVQ